MSKIFNKVADKLSGNENHEVDEHGNRLSEQQHSHGQNKGQSMKSGSANREYYTSGQKPGRQTMPSQHQGAAGQDIHSHGQQGMGGGYSQQQRDLTKGGSDPEMYEQDQSFSQSTSRQTRSKTTGQKLDDEWDDDETAGNFGKTTKNTWGSSNTQQGTHRDDDSSKDYTSRNW